jgi:hypothetical protein
VPTAANVQALNAIYKSASSIMIVALFPPNYNKTFPNLSFTFCWIIFPTFVEPVKEIRGILLSSTILAPIYTSP